MNTQVLRVDVKIPSVEDFAASYPHYGPRVHASARPLFDLVMRAETFVHCASVTACLGLPAVAAVAAEATEVMGGAIEGRDKQIVGALVCALMTANGHRKTGRKRAISHRAWTKGEVYERITGARRAPAAD